MERKEIWHEMDKISILDYLHIWITKVFAHKLSSGCFLFSSKCVTKYCEHGSESNLGFLLFLRISDAEENLVIFIILMYFIISCVFFLQDRSYHIHFIFYVETVTKIVLHLPSHLQYKAWCASKERATLNCFEFSWQITLAFFVILLLPELELYDFSLNVFGSN